MANSPLELYNEAYTLHYTHGKIADACKIYREIVRSFPESNECAYSAIQLEKIGAGEIVRSLGLFPQATPVGLLALLAASALVTVILIVALATTAHRGAVRFHQTTAAMRALAKLSAGQDQEALRLLDTLKIIDTRDMLPFEMSAEIYLKDKNYAKALGEIQIYRTLNHSVAGAEQIARIQKAAKDAGADASPR